jgi:hypothetical protein
MSWIILSPDGVPLGLDPGRFDAAVKQQWPGQWEQQAVLGTAEVTLGITIPGETWFQVDLSAAGRSVRTDGTWPQAARVAAWVRSLLPPGFPARVWLIDQAYTGHADLPAGVTADHVAAGWLDHALHGEPTDVV